jgi:hypothetical protein
VADKRPLLRRVEPFAGISFGCPVVPLVMVNM